MLVRKKVDGRRPLGEDYQENESDGRCVSSALHFCESIRYRPQFLGKEGLKFWDKNNLVLTLKEIVVFK